VYLDCQIYAWCPCVPHSQYLCAPTELNRPPTGPTIPAQPEPLSISTPAPAPAHFSHARTQVRPATGTGWTDQEGPVISPKGARGNTVSGSCTFPKSGGATGATGSSRHISLQGQHGTGTVRRPDSQEDVVPRRDRRQSPPLPTGMSSSLAGSIGACSFEPRFTGGGGRGGGGGGAGADWDSDPVFEASPRHQRVSSMRVAPVHSSSQGTVGGTAGGSSTASPHAHSLKSTTGSFRGAGGRSTRVLLGTDSRASSECSGTTVTTACTSSSADGGSSTGTAGGYYSPSRTGSSTSHKLKASLARSAQVVGGSAMAPGSPHSVGTTGRHSQGTSAFTLRAASVEVSAGGDGRATPESLEASLGLGPAIQRWDACGGPGAMARGTPRGPQVEHATGRRVISKELF
jgi:hypothetical protein